MGWFNDFIDPLNIEGRKDAAPPLQTLLDPLNLSGTKKPPALGTPPVAPTIDNSQAQLDAADQEMAMRMNRGRTSTILNGATGVDASKNTSKILLGS